MKSTILEVEFDAPNNASLYFRPLMRNVRGRFDARRVPNAGKLYSQWSEPIPGQRLQLDVSTGEAAIVEPLYEDQHKRIRERIEAKGMKLPPEREVVTADAATWCYWLRPLVEQGKCRIVRGELPTKIDGTPQTRFHSVEHADPIDKLTAAFNRLSDNLEKLLAKQTPTNAGPR